MPACIAGTKLEDIKTVFSHPQGLLQSRSFMREHPQYEGVEYGSTAAAAKKWPEIKTLHRRRLPAGVRQRNTVLK